MTVLYDGNCRFCRAHIQILRFADWSGKLSYLSLHDPGAKRYVGDIPSENVLSEMYVVDRAGRRRGGVDAVRYLARKLPLFWPIALILHIPGTRSFWAWLYRKIAARRYWFGRVACESGACSLD